MWDPVFSLQEVFIWGSHSSNTLSRGWALKKDCFVFMVGLQLISNCLLPGNNSVLRLCCVSCLWPLSLRVAFSIWGSVRGPWTFLKIYVNFLFVSFSKTEVIAFIRSSKASVTWKRLRTTALGANSSSWGFLSPSWNFTSSGSTSESSGKGPVCNGVLNA